MIAIDKITKIHYEIISEGVPYKVKKTSGGNISLSEKFVGKNLLDNNEYYLIFKKPNLIFTSSRDSTFEDFIDKVIAKF